MDRRQREHEEYDSWGNHPGEARVSVGQVGNGTANAIVKWLAALVAVLASGAIGFAYGRIWDHEHRITILETTEIIRERANPRNP